MEIAHTSSLAMLKDFIVPGTRLTYHFNNMVNDMDFPNLQ